ncbi:MAG: thioredoxin domain-containing protein [Thermoplasmatales archaeon]
MRNEDFERSTYLASHRSDPVAWNIWSEELFKVAKEKDKPIFITIGYSTCHWCHVMQEESFRDREIANILNTEYIPVVVDREERPDVDSFYMNVSQLMNGNGGWPLNVIAMPDGRPFQVFTYIPPRDSGEMGLLGLLRAISEIWKNERGRIIEAVDQVSSILLLKDRGDPGEIDFDAIADTLRGMYDRSNGGFGREPKFPNFTYLMYLMNYMDCRGNKNLSFLVEKTLRAIRNGGIYDQVGYGIHRYSTDSEWKIPHFEKMLYDQAMALETYTSFYRFSGDKKYLKVAGEIEEFVEREMTRDGLLISGLDADFNGEEGLFYMWTQEELLSFGNREYDMINRCYYFEELPSGRIVLRRRETVPEFIDNVNEMLRKRRAERGNLRMDDKFILSWNAMYLNSLIDYYVTAGVELATIKRSVFKLLSAFSSDDTLYRTVRKGIKGVRALLEDYAYLCNLLISIFEFTGEGQFLAAAVKYLDQARAFFLDEREGGFFSSYDSGDRPVLRGRDRLDIVYPSGESTLFIVLEKMYILTGDQRYKDMSNSIVHSRRPEAVLNPLSSISFITYLLLSQRLLRIGIPTERIGEFLSNYSKVYSVTDVLSPGGQKIEICNPTTCMFETESVSEALEYIKKYRSGQNTIPLSH